MKNLHKIKSAVKLRDGELSVLAYCELGYESNWEFRIINNILLSKKINNSSWTPVIGYWSTVNTIKIWEKYGKFMPNLSVIKNA